MDRTAKPKMLIVDDEASITFSLKHLFSSYDVTDIADGSRALEILGQGAQFDLLIIDYRLQAVSGLDILRAAKASLRLYRAILLTAYASKEILENAINDRLIFRVVDKPFDPEQMKTIVNEAWEDLQEEKRKENSFVALKEQLEEYMAIAGKCGGQVFVHKSDAIKEIIETAKKYGATSQNVHITGENGVGKEIIANIVHSSSKRKDRPMIRINCAAIPHSIFESELFGHVRGTFTGAVSDRKGKFELAQGGTILLDEIGDLPLDQQPKILRAIENKEISPLGSSETMKIDVRIISSTNKDLVQMVKDGKFREDLYHRLSVLNIVIPPLREHREDIPLLAAYFLKKVENEEGGISKDISSEALEAIVCQDFTGNARELENIITELYLKSEGQVISKNDVQTSYDNRNREFKEGFENFQPYHQFMESMERQYLEKQLEQNNYSLTRTANLIKMQPSNLCRKLKELGIDLKKKAV
jgi:two-component system nitrogen regulation response regulator NtrX